MIWLLQEAARTGLGPGGIFAGGAALTGLGMSGMLKGGAFSHGISGFMGNPLVQGGVIMGILMWAWNFVRSSPSRIIGYFKNKMIVTINVGDTDSKRILLDWFSEHPYGKKAKNVLLDNKWERGQNVPVIRTGPGDHVVSYNGRKIWLKIERKNQKDKNQASWSDDFEQYTITINAFRGGRNFIQQFVQEVWAHKNREVQDKILVEKYASFWQTFGMTDKRSINSLIFADDTPARILADIQQFEAEKTWYKEMDIPHTRGFLLYGEPGNGKSSLVRAMATELNKSIATFNISDVYSDGALLQALTHVPKGSIVLIEDVDAIFAKNAADTLDIDPEEDDEEPEKETTSASTDEPALKRSKYNRDITPKGVSFSGVLNALDGVMTTQSRILFMTTNRKEVLDAALIRPGRVDKTIYIGNATKDQIRRFYSRFFPSDSPETVDAFVDQFGENEKSMAEIQEILLSMKEARRKQFVTAKG